MLRRLVLTSEALLDRRTSTYEVAERRPLAALASIVRFSDEPQWLALEWTDGAPPNMYITSSRDALLSAILDTAQVVISTATHTQKPTSYPILQMPGAYRVDTAKVSSAHSKPDGLLLLSGSPTASTSALPGLLLEAYGWLA